MKAARVVWHFFPLFVLAALLLFLAGAAKAQVTTIGGKPSPTAPAVPVRVLTDGTLVTAATVSTTAISAQVADLWAGSSSTLPQVDSSGYSKVSAAIRMSDPTAYFSGSYKLQASNDGLGWSDIVSTSLSPSSSQAGYQTAVYSLSHRYVRGVYTSTLAPVQRFITVADVDGSLAGKYVLASGAQSSTYPLGAAPDRDGGRYAFWFRVSGAGVSPGPVTFGGRVYQPVAVDITANATASAVATALAAAMSTVRGGFYTSEDGLTWTQRAMPTYLVPLVGTFGNGKYVFVGNGGAYQSTDGVNWSYSSTGVPAGTVNDVLWVGGSINLFIASVAGTTSTSIWTSPDGVTWTSRTSTVSSLGGLCTDGTTVVALATGSSSSYNYSTNGTAWSAGTLATTGVAQSCAWTGTNFAVAFNTQAVFNTSANGQSGWVTRAVTSATYGSTAASPSGVVVSVPVSGVAPAAAMFSKDGGVTWGTAYLAGATGTANRRALTWDAVNSRFILGAGTTSMVSSDGFLWRSSAAPFVASSAMQAVVVGSTGRAVASPAAPSTEFTALAVSDVVSFKPVAATGTLPASAGTSGFVLDQIIPWTDTRLTSTIYLIP